MISKKIKVTLLAAVLMITGIAQTTLADTTTKKDTNIEIESKFENSEEDMTTLFDSDFEDMSFEDLVGDMKKDIKKEDLVKLEKNFNEAVALEKEEKIEAADKKWDEFYNIFDKYMPEMTDYEEMSFEDFIGEMKEDIKKEDLAKLEKTYKEIQTLEKAQKFEESDKKWNEFYNILDKYIPEMAAFEEMSFEDFIGETKQDIKKEDLVKLEKIFKDIETLEKAQKFEELDKKWNEFYNIFDKYMPETICNDLIDCEDFKDDMNQE
ncbi:hypothetical protein [Oceanirhabdus seepicola]|uniref:DUF3347 domain-containing protein n=1 Tax=Oceanirhabdus seepicola TaxID=2828781 RepID=A0A9J6P1J8_9CLOT|nr:hypothetical protein [Oceanirhabdus seepicola]MCM1989749.1 hypothetical protein [Oceanirhabdus seepicola]